MIGSFLKNHYRIIQKLGQGAWDSTYLVEDLQSQTPSFLIAKQFQPNYTNCRSPSEQAALYQEAQHLFQREAVTLKKLAERTSQVPKIKDYFDENSQFYLIQEWIEGEALSKQLQDGRPWTQQAVLQLLIEILQPLDFCHQQGIIHRDLQPKNLIRRRQGELAIVDFGTMQEIGQLTLVPSSRPADSLAIGTAGYLPTEQYYGSPVLASDIYAVGAIGIQSLTGVHPHQIPLDRATGIPAWGQMPNCQPTTPAFAQVLNRMLAAMPEARYPNAGEALAALRTVGAQALNLPVTPPKPPAPPSQAGLSQKMFTFEAAKLQQCQELMVGKKSGTLVDDISGWLIGEVSGMLGMAETKASPAKATKATKAAKADSEWQVNKTSGKAKYFQVDLGNGVQLEMVAIPAGSFTMGSSPQEANSLYHEQPQRVVTVPAFYMGRYPVTQAQYQAIMGNNPAARQDALLPIENVSWHDAQQFCQRLSLKTGRKYRLPSEAEWEYACRAGTTTAFCFGEKITSAVANFSQEQTSAVGCFPANDFGLSDMHGNVWEWCEDHWHHNYEGMPTNSSAAVDVQAAVNSERVLRGGSWFGKPEVCRSAYRYKFASNFHFKDIGFRVVYAFAQRSQSG